jgi:Mn2+/Fe2+ NRAMP family transporter
MPVDAAPQSTLKASDPYLLTPEAVDDPPRSIAATFRKIGPGMILAASIVGSGELIATTTLGAQAGFVALWIILFSCFIKPIVQAELGRFVISTGETGLEAFDQVPGPRFKVNWIVWIWALMVFMTQFQVGAMFGGVAQVLHSLMPVMSVNLWVLPVVAISLALLLGGGYRRIESLAMVKVGFFTMLTVLSAAMVMKAPAFNWGQLLDGLWPRIPAGGWVTAVAVFGMTGVGASEIFMYPYWCVEKGYARFTGPRDGSRAWTARASGWIRVMHLDVVFSMLVYTIATCAFYVLGAGVLHPKGLVPDSSTMIATLSELYTSTLGEWALVLFYIGAVATLYGTIFAATAAHSRIYADMVRMMGGFAREDSAARNRWRDRFVIALTIIPVLLFYVFKNPVSMVVAGGLAQALSLPVICIGVLYLRHKLQPKETAPGWWNTMWLWIAGILITVLMGVYLAGEL